MLLSALSVLVVAQSSSEIPEGLMNNPEHKLLHVAELAGPSLGRSALPEDGLASSEACRSLCLLEHYCN